MHASHRRYLLELIQTRIWIIPVFLALLGGVMAPGVMALDAAWRSALVGYPDWGFSPDSARTTLQVLAGAVISVGGVAFSMAMVAMTMASSQYGPKLLRNFLGDTASKLTLGWFLASFAYSVTVLLGLGDEVPQATILLALLLALTSLAAFVHFIHRIATQLQADEIIQHVGRKWRHALLELSQEGQNPRRGSNSQAWRQSARGHPRSTLPVQTRGYVQSIDYAALVAACRHHNCQLLLHLRAGDLTVPGARLITIFDPAGQTDHDLADALRAAIVTGPVRSPVQDPEFAIAQLLQLAQRALSPAINDSGTAITCIDWFTLALAETSDAAYPGFVFHDADAIPRVLARGIYYRDLLRAIYGPLGQHARGDLAVTLALVTALARLASLTADHGRLALLRTLGEEIAEAASPHQRAPRDQTDLRRALVRLRRSTAATSAGVHRDSRVRPGASS